MYFFDTGKLIKGCDSNCDVNIVQILKVKIRSVIFLVIVIIVF